MQDFQIYLTNYYNNSIIVTNIFVVLYTPIKYTLWEFFNKKIFYSRKR